MYESLSLFSKPTRAWFARAFSQPTAAQEQAWPSIRSGDNVLVIAPTGSGKTLAAFLSAIDGLIAGRMNRPCATSEAERDAHAAHDVGGSNVDHACARLGQQGSGGKHRREGVRVLYISPLKALAADVATNLKRPLEGIAAQCAVMNLPMPDITVAIRSGDSTAQERRRIASHPPDILVTTPESLYLLLTSKAGRILNTVDTVIVDEIHAIAGSKRGAHLALSLERLERQIELSRDRDAAGKPTSGSSAATQANDGRGGDSRQDAFQRIGLSATVNPPEEAARFLGGNRQVTIINAGGSPDMDLRVIEPLADMHDLQSANVKHRIGDVDASRPPAPAISGVTPAMQRLGERQELTKRRGLAKLDGDGIGYQSIAGAAGDGMNGVGSLGEGNAGSIWPVVERSILDEILTHRTTLVFVNSRGLAEKLTARLNDMYAQSRADFVDKQGGVTSNPAIASDLGSPEGRENFARHYDAVIGGTTQLVHAHDAVDTIAMAHHGSVSKDRRKRIEEDLKHGRLRCVVATSSLELGIDMGSVDLVIQIAPPLSVSSGLQRVGRADHRVGGVSHALFYPLTREQIIGIAASVESMRAGDIEPLHLPRNPLDILAQQTVAAVAMEDLDTDQWYDVVRRAAPFAQLDRPTFDAVIGMMTGAYDTEDFSAFRPPLMFNEENGLVSARPGAQRLAVTSGGTIPDRGLYTVVLPEADAGNGQRRVGELDEEMVYESRVGDVITLGTSTWQIQDITRDRVIVTPAPGRTARLPFWHGEGIGRDAGFGKTKGRFLRDISAGLSDGASFDAAIMQRLKADGLDANAIGNLATLLSEQRASTGVIPNDRQLVIERCPDEEGDWHIILHSPYGRRVHEPWSMAISQRIKQRYGFDGQTYAADDGIVIRLPDGVFDADANVADNGFNGPASQRLSSTNDFGADRRIIDLPQHRRIDNSRLRDLLLFDPDELTRDIETQIGESVLFAARFRECAARSLFLPRTDPGRRVPLWQQRLRASQLLNAARTRRNFPLLLETARECLQDVYDMPALRALMTDLRSGIITLSDVRTPQPSPLAENLLFGYVGQVMYQYDVPQAERSVQLLSVDPQALERLLGTDDMASVLDQQVIAEVERELSERTFWNELSVDDIVGRVTRYAKTHGPFTADMLMRGLNIDATTAVRTLDELVAKGELLQGRFASDNPDNCSHAVQWLHRDVFQRIRNRSLKKARAAIKPVAPQVYQSFLLERQGVGPVGGERYKGVDGLMRVIEQLEGVALSARVWEESVFPARMHDYAPAMLDELIASGEVIWIGSGGAKTGAAELVSFHPADSALLAGLASPISSKHGPISAISGERCESRSPSSSMPHQHPGSDVARRVTAGVGTLPDAILDILDTGGAYRADQLASLVRRRWEEIAPEVDPVTGEIIAKPWSAKQFEEALWSLVWQGSVTSSSFTPVRAVQTASRRVCTPVRASRRHIHIQFALPASMSGLWMAVGSPDSAENDAISPEATIIERVETLLDRYGVIAQPLVDKENLPGGFSGLYPVLKRMEGHGRLVRGMFVNGFGAAQFADKATVDALRAQASRANQSALAVAALDPANLSGAAIAWPPVPEGAAKPVRRANTIVVMEHGEPVLLAVVKGKHLTVFRDSSTPLCAAHEDNAPAAMGEAEASWLRRACTELAYALRRGGERSITFADVNGEPLHAGHPFARILHQAGFTPVPQGMRLYLNEHCARTIFAEYNSQRNSIDVYARPPICSAMLR